METKDKPLWIKCNIQDPKGFFLPKGRTFLLEVKIVDGFGLFNFNNKIININFSKMVKELEKKAGVNNTFYSEKTDEIITEYPNMNKEEIKTKILKQLKLMGANVKCNKTTEV